MVNGASGYVLKNATRGELPEAIETVMRGKLFFSVDAGQLMRLASEKPDASVVTRRE